MRILGLDYGSLTVGVAVSDETATIAGRVETIRRDKESKIRRTLRRIEELVDEYDAGLIVLGLPLYLDGRPSPRCEVTREFGKALEKRTGLNVVMWDERLTSVEAEDVMRSIGVPREKWKEQVDCVAAEIILQDYLDELRNDKD